jgi:hypothetical protein
VLTGAPAEIWPKEAWDLRRSVDGLVNQYFSMKPLRLAVSPS